MIRVRLYSDTGFLDEYYLDIDKKTFWDNIPHPILFLHIFIEEEKKGKPITFTDFYCKLNEWTLLVFKTHLCKILP